MLAGPKRSAILATTMAGQAKNVLQVRDPFFGSNFRSKYYFRRNGHFGAMSSFEPFQAEIDAACELIDFFTFNVQSALELEQSQPLSPDFGITNKIHYRAREGFVAAISPFNFTAIGGNLAGTPAMMGNPTLWKARVLF